MQQQSRRMEPTRQTRKEQDQSKASRREGSSPLPAELALQALLAGCSLEQLPAQAVLALSGKIGNSALLAVLASQKAGPQLTGAGLPPPASTRPLACTPAQPQLEAAPPFGALAFPAGGALEL